MDIYVFPDQVVLCGKMKYLTQQLGELAKKYYSIQQLIEANLP
ncbi:hypothetical protein [Candidatus Formimonas warabiya]|nr:hypothetical protein [Candidatus Formimonas warabiya]